MHTAEQRVLLGNEAIARGLVEAGCQFATSYPGTPSSEILPGIVRFKEELGLPIYAEWSTNEKVALETALAAAYSGKRTAVAMKQVGLNVAADPALSSAYIGVVGGLVLVVADDPGPHSSQTEQDTRLFARFAKLPVLDPATPQEAKDLCARAFDLSERHQVPVILRPTLRICHARQSVACGPVAPGPRAARFERNPRRWAATPRARLELHKGLNDKLAAIAEEFSGWPENRLRAGSDRHALGVVASGVSYAYLAEVLGSLGIEEDVAVLKLATPYPLPASLLEALAERCDRILVLEEPDAVVEHLVRVGVPVWGRLTGHVPTAGEITPERVREIVAAAAREAGLDPAPLPDTRLRRAVEALGLPIRRPTLCPGCGHRAAFYAIRRAFPDGLFPGDIGCYTLGLNLGAVDTVHDMGASISMAAGFHHAHAQDGDPPPILATIGDSTFYHSGAAALENAVYNGARFVLVILDNEVTGMTGMQPTPEFGTTADGHPGRPVNLEALVRGCGVEYVVGADPYDIPGFQRVLREAWAHTRDPRGGVAVVVARYPCVTRIKGLGPDHERVPVEVRHGPLPREPDGTWKPTWMPRHQNKISPCAEACPAGNDVERLMALAAEERWSEALELLLQEHPFPAALGRVCPHPCEGACNRAEYDEAVAIHAVERVAGDAAESPPSWLRPGEPSGRSVAVVGAGPAGLTAAYHLARLGHRVEVLEALPEPGGLLRWAIPEYRLPTAVVRREVERLEALGVTIRTGVRVGTEVPLSELSRFDAVLLATGAWQERSLGIPGENRPGVWPGLTFLRRVRGAEAPEVGRRVAVIGGGNTAIDAARTARRMGAEVTVYYRRGPERMRAIPEEVEAARAEGIFFRFNLAPQAIEAGSSRALSLKLRDTAQAEAEAYAVPPRGDGPAAEFWTEVDTVIYAVGLEPGPPGDRVRADGPDPWGRTPIPRTYLAGDAAGDGGGTVAAAVNGGKRAALAIHADLTGEPLDERALRIGRGPGVPAEIVYRGQASPRAGRVQATPPLRTVNLRDFPRRPRPPEPHLPPDEAIWSFDEVVRGLPPARAAGEARDRCFHCGVCTLCDTCLKACPYGAIRREGDGYVVDGNKCTLCRLCQVECPRSAITMPRTETCVGCGYCTTWFECPALVRGPDGLVEVDRRICIECGLCIQVCPQQAIQPRTA